MELQYSDHKIWIENEQGKVVGEVDFVQRDDGNYDIVHTFVDDSLRGQGAAGKLVKAAADEIRCPVENAAFSIRSLPASSPSDAAALRDVLGGLSELVVLLDARTAAGPAV